MNIPEHIVRRFWSKVKLGGPDECWMWEAAMARGGYGCRGPDEHERGAHRFSYVLEYGPIPPGLFILHSCDEPACVNPGHLRAGTHLENMDDMARRGRKRFGQVHPSARLTDEDVREIRACYGDGSDTQRSLGERYGVSQGHISHIVNRRFWNKLV